jgi:hypothetical protein
VNAVCTDADAVPVFSSEFSGPKFATIGPAGSAGGAFRCGKQRTVLSILVIFAPVLAEPRRGDLTEQLPLLLAQLLFLAQRIAPDTVRPQGLPTAVQFLTSVSW